MVPLYVVGYMYAEASKMCHSLLAMGVILKSLLYGCGLR